MILIGPLVTEIPLRRAAKEKKEKNSQHADLAVKAGRAECHARLSQREICANLKKKQQIEFIQSVKRRSCVCMHE